MADRQKVTLKTIAEQTGLALATVSRALNDDPAIKQSTRDTVQKVAQELGYVRDPAALRLRTGRSQTVAAVFPVGFELSNHASRLMNAVANTLRNTSYTMTIMPYFDEEDPLVQIRKIVEFKLADGIIINSLEPNDSRVAYMLEKEFPFVSHGRCNWSDQHDYFDFDNRAFGFGAVKLLAQRGRKHIRLIAPPQHQSYGREMFEGGRAAAAQLGVTFDRFDDFTSDTAPEEIRIGVERCVNASAVAKGIEPIDALVTPSAPSCMAGLDAVRALGRTLQTDMDVVVKETPDVLVWLPPGILTVPEDTRVAGNFIARALLRRIKDPNAPLSQKLIVPDFA